jgi:hypothetical protein
VLNVSSRLAVVGVGQLAVGVEETRFSVATDVGVDEQLSVAESRRFSADG